MKFRKIVANVLLPILILFIPIIEIYYFARDGYNFGGDSIDL